MTTKKPRRFAIRQRLSQKEGGPIPLEEVLPHVRAGVYPERKVKILLRGEQVKVSSLRLQTFATHGVKCVKCGIQGAHFLLERSTDNIPWHLNLYALREDGVEVLMTKDHIQPRSKGGFDRLDNLQPMCFPCNQEKADHEPT